MKLHLIKAFHQQGRFTAEDMYLLAAEVVNQIAAHRMDGEWNLRTTPKMIADEFIKHLNKK